MQNYTHDRADDAKHSDTEDNAFCPPLRRLACGIGVLTQVAGAVLTMLGDERAWTRLCWAAFSAASGGEAPAN
jgi:hypothetical protein